jgi:hypothetical protein
MRCGIALALVLGQLCLALTGCMSVKATGSTPAEGEGGGVAVRLFADDGAMRSGQPGPGGVLAELQRKEGDRWVPVFRSLNPTWVVVGLKPGTYRLGFPARLDQAGNVQVLGRGRTAVRVEEGKVTQVRAIMDHVSPVLVAVAVVTVVAAAVVLADYLKDHDLPRPPPPPPVLLDLAFHISINFVFDGRWYGVSSKTTPAVTSHFPAADAIVAARRPRLVFEMSEPLKPTSLEGSAITVLGESSGVLAGVVGYDAEHWWVTWTPREDLAPGDVYHATLAAGALKDEFGNEMEDAVSFSFSTAR